MDGASFWRIYVQIIMPLSRPVVATLGIFTFLGSWNDFLWPLIMISSVENKTLPLGLTMFRCRFQSRHRGSWSWPRPVLRDPRADRVRARAEVLRARHRDDGVEGVVAPRVEQQAARTD